MRKTDLSRICLIHPPTHAYRGLGASLAGNEHIGLEYIASYLQNSEYSVYILNIEGNYQSPQYIAKQIFLMHPLWVGISPTSLSIEWTVEFVNYLRKLATIPLVFGGHLSSHMGKDFLRKTQHADVVVIGDGEFTAFKLSKAFESREVELENVPGIIFRRGSKIIDTGPPVLPASLDELPWPIRPALDFVGKSDSARILTSRGCLYHCSFCTTPAFYKRQIRYRSVENVVREMLFLNQKYGVSSFQINDDIFIDGSQNSIRRIRDFARLLRDNLPSISFRPLCRTDVFLRHERLLSELSAAGMKCAFIGLESVNDNDLKYLRKGLKGSQNEMIIELLEKHNVSLMIGFIMYTNVSTFASLRQNLQYLYSIDQLYRTTAICRTSLGFPGTNLYNEMIQTDCFDKQRSTPFVLYPKFNDPRIRDLSLAMEEVEALFSTIDRKMLSTRIYLFDEQRRLSNGKNPALQRARSVLNKVMNIYFNSFTLALNKAEAGNPTEKIVTIFKKVLPEIEALCSDFELLLKKDNRLNNGKTLHTNRLSWSRQDNSV